MILVDAYNVLQTPGVLPPRLAGIEVTGLVRLIRRSRHAGRRLVIVCDGSGSSGGRGREVIDGADVHYSGPHSEADAVIERMLVQASAARTWTVISSDRRIQRAARRVRADVLDSRTFLEQLVADESHRRKDGLPPFATEVPLDRYSVAHWMEEFGFEGSDALNAPARPRAAEPRPSAPSLAKRSRSQPAPAPPIRAGPVDPASTPIPSLVPPISDPILLRAASDPQARLVLAELDMARWLPPAGSPLPDPGPKRSSRVQKNKSRTSRDRKSKG